MRIPLANSVKTGDAKLQGLQIKPASYQAAMLVLKRLLPWQVKLTGKMMCINNIKVASVTLAALSTLAISPDSNAATYAPWLTQIGISDAVMSASNWGKGQVLGVVDTGIVAAAFAAGQVSVAQSSCAATTTGICPKGVLDDNGHGTAVAAIAAANGGMPFSAVSGGYTTLAGSVMGVAPNANIVAEKVLNASGSGYSTDVSNGIVKAANAGATVINLSLTFIPDATTIAAINYAASKGAFIVYAGGNSAAALTGGANTSGLTVSAINHLVFAGSVNAKNVLSTFSNTPGAGSLVSAITNTKTAYSARWIMAPGENIIAPGIQYGAASYASWSGTSMAAPIVSGSLMLLQNTWPILRTNGTTANLLLATATDLGAKGVDTTYGNGLVNLTTAFQPNGALMITEANGNAIPLSSLTGTLISAGALGSLAGVTSKLASYTTLDSYSRNFTVNLSGMIKAPASAAILNSLPVSIRTAPNKMALAGGTELSYVMPAAPDRASMLGVFGVNSGAALPNQSAYAMLTDSKGTSMALGYGNLLPAQYSYTRALYGSEDAAMVASDLATHLSSLSQGGLVSAYGLQFGEGTRVAVSYSKTAAPNLNSGDMAWAMPDASNVGVGITQTVSKQLQLGFSMQSLDEKHGLLGSAYDPASSLSMGSSNHSDEFGVSALVSLDANHSLYMEASQSTTKAARPAAGSLFAGTTDLHAQAFGMSYMAKNILTATDKFTASVKQPMRVTSGSVNMAVTNIDPVTGVPSLGLNNVSLAPAGKEIDFKVSYNAPLSKTQSLSLSAGYMKDAMNMAGNTFSNVGASWAVRF